MLNKRIINTGVAGAACTTDTTQILDAGKTQSLALYRFEDNANDTASSTGKFGKGAIFNGSSSQITLPAALSDGSTTDTNCISFWFNVDAEVTSSSSNNEIMMFSKSGSNDGKIALGSTTGNFSNETFSVTSDVANQYTYITETIPAGWNHAVVQWNSSTTKWDIYLNGQAKSTSTFGTNEQGKLFLNFGKRSSYYYNGKLDQVRVFNKSLSSSEVTTLYNETSSTVNTLQILGDTSCIATYRFEGNAQDLSGNYYHGSASNVIYDYSGTASNITYTTGKFGKAGVFNGSSSKIDLPDNILPDNSTGSSSASVWFKSSSGNTAGDSETILDAYAYDTNKPGWGLFMEPAYGSNPDGHLYLANYSLGGTSGGTSTGYRDGNWHHAVVVLDNPNNTIKVYVDGNSTPVLSQTASAANVWPFTEKAAIGYQNANASYPRYFNGNIDQVRIFNKALSLAEINSLYNETATTAALATINNPSTVAYYKMADGTDETGFYNGTATDVDFNVEGKYGFAGKFNGSSSRINTGLIWPGGTQISCSLWINTAGGVNQYLFGGFDDSGSNASNRLAFQFHNSNVLYILTNGAGGGLGTTTNAGSIASYLNKWTHIVVTVSGTEVKAYLDGSLFHTSTGTALAAGSQPFIIGAYTDNSSRQNVNGRIDQVRIFNKAISASEVTKLYNEVQCADTITAPENYFNTVLYTGTGAIRSVTGVGFEPGFVWIKDRGTNGANHVLSDSVRGTGRFLISNNTDTEYVSSGGTLSSFDSDGFSLAAASPAYDFNINTNTYVAWNWKAASSNTTNNDGSITSTVRASQESGFSIVKYAGNGTAGSTVGHGLGVVPSLIIWKNIDATSNWLVYSPLIGNDSQWLYLNLTSSAQTSGSTNEYPTNKVDPTSSVVTVNGSGSSNNINISGQDTIMYCFANIDGYQRIGSYVGNGSSTNGPYVFTGFEPAWLLIKKTSSSGDNWVIYDNKRNTTNPRFEFLVANDNDAETGTNASNWPILDFLSNGFVIKGTDGRVNTSGSTYLFWAIAANPDTTAPTKANSFNIKLYTGDDSNNRSITGLGFKPDFVWIKRRLSGSESHAIYDSVRGPNLQLSSDTNATEATNSGSYLGMSSFDADGFNVGNNGGTNRAPHDYVAWAWKALDHDRNLASINKDGDNNTIVSVNEEAGFGIVKGYVTTNGYTASLGHGFEVKPEFIIYKPLLSGHNWWSFADYGGSLLGNNNVIKFNDVTIAQSDSLFSITDEAFKTGATSSAHSFIAYCWRSVEGYSKIGTYTGASGSKRVYNTSDGTSTGSGGFTPSFIIIRNRGVAGAWMIYDSVRSSDPLNKTLMVNYSSAEQTQSSATINLHSDGFTINGNIGASNTNGNSYFYMAFK